MRDDMDLGTEAKRFNEGKAPMHLLPFWLLRDLSEHYAKGAEKYEPWNWTKGGKTDTCFGALLRHITLWQMGEDIDIGTEEEPGTMTHHMLAVAWNALTLYHGYKLKLDTDLRPTQIKDMFDALIDSIRDGTISTDKVKGN